MDCIVPGVTRLNDFHFVSLQFIHAQLLEEQVSTASLERGINVIKISSSIYDSEIPLLETALCRAAGLSGVQLFGTALTEARQAPLSMGILQARILEWVAMPSSETALSTNTIKKKNPLDQGIGCLTGCIQKNLEPYKTVKIVVAHN